jgi:RNA 2',3'-cyclic 3'-phosphodiesterase
MAETATAEFFRLFVAVTVPDDTKAEIEKAQAAMSRALPKEAVRWTKREQFHLTLKFLGSVDTQRVAELTEALRTACRGFAPLELRAEQIGCFPNLRRPRVVWVGVHDQEQQLPELQRAIEAAVRDYTKEEAEERFTGHVTLGRVKDLRRHEAETLASLVSDHSTRVFGAWTSDRVELIRSQLSSQGARYTTVAALPLGSLPRPGNSSDTGQGGSIVST